MSELSRALGTPEQIEYKGKQYQLSALEIEVVAMFEQWLKRRALESLRQMKSMMSDEEYKEQFANVIRDAAAGTYSLFSSVGQKSLQSIDGVKQMVYLRLKRHHPECDEEFVDNMLADKFDEILVTMKAMDSDPNRKAPANQPGNSTGAMPSASSPTNHSASSPGKSVV